MILTEVEKRILERAKAALERPHGRINSEWQADVKDFEYIVDLLTPDRRK